MMSLDQDQRRRLRALAISVAVYAAVLLLHFFAVRMSDGRQWMSWAASSLFIFCYIWVGYPVICEAWRGVRDGDLLNETFLMMVATVGALLIGEYSEAVAVMLFYQAGEFMQDLAVERSRQSVAALMDIAPQYARVVRGGGAVRVSPEELSVGDQIEIRAGERIPVDCVVLSGQSHIDASSLTGEAVPVLAVAGSALLGGGINGEGRLLARVTSLFKDSAVSRILELVEHASQKKARTERFITRFARWYTPSVIAAALLLAVVPACLGADWHAWLYRACMFLVVSCPCALVISIPMGFFCGIGAASRHGILVKGGTALENAAAMHTLAFDKTGTLTEGRFSITAMCAFGIGEGRLRAMAATLEQGSNHPIAVAIRDGMDTDMVLENFRELPGKGVQGQIGDALYGLGNERILDEFAARCPQSPPPGGTAVYLCAQGRCLGWMLLDDAIKEDAAEAMRALRRQGVRQLVMLTGDRGENARRVAEALGFDQVHAALLPQGKVEAMEALLRRDRNAAFVGDGINDAPVLMRANLGVAMGGIGSDAAIEAADVVLVTDRLSRLPMLVAIARKTLRLVRENIALALAVKASVLILGAAGMANMWWAIFADVGVALLAIANAGRAFICRQCR